MNFQFIKLQLYLLLFSLTFFLTCEDKNTDSGKFGAVHVEIVFDNDNSQNNNQSTNNGIKSFMPKKELFRTIGKNNETDEVAEENIQGLHTEKDVNNSVLNKSLSGDITSITITISGVDPVNVDVSSGETVSKTIDGVPVGQQTVKIDLKDSAGTIIYTQTQTVEVTVGETSSPSFSADEFTPENLSITVTSPNGGESWEIGTTHNITWNSSHSSLNVKIELYQGGSAYQTISSSESNDGSYSWAIPSTYNESSDYKVRISYVSDENENDESNGNFTLAAPPSSITVTSPNGGEEWELGSSQNITWTSTNISGNVLISLLKGGSFYMSINTNTSNDGSYSWTIPETYDEGTDYKVRISSVSDGTVYDESDGDFTLVVTIPANDDCANAEAVTSPYPVEITSTNANSTVDCAGYLDWNAIWYELELPYGTNNVDVYVQADGAISSAGIILMDDCACDDYISYTGYDWDSTGGWINVWFDDVSGADNDGTILFPLYIDAQQGFTVTFDVTDGGGGEMCNYSISLYDSYGDGWHGNNFANLYINGSLYSSYTLSSGSGPETYTFPVDDGDAVHTTFTEGSYSYECYYYIYDSEGNEVAVDGTGSYYDDPPDGVAPFTASCDGGRTSVGTIPVLITKDKIFESSNKSTRLHKSVPWKLNSKNGE